jgi:hypothetical protein
MSYVPNPYSTSAYQADVFPQSALIGQGLMADVPDSPVSSGTVIGVAIPAPSSTIDPAITLGVSFQVDTGVQANAIATGVKIPIMFAPYTYDGLQVTNATLELYARKGYAACIPVTRGRGFSTGTVDDSGRDLYDVKDCAAAVAASQTYVDETKIDALCWSGGAANFLALAAKYPGFLRNVLLAAGWGDYGSNPGADRSFWGSGIPGYQALMTARIGNRVTQIERYRARCIWPALRCAQRQSTTRIWQYWDAGDAIGRASRDTWTTLGYDAAIGGARWQAEESNLTSPIRWLHGLPDVGVNDLPKLMNLIFRERNSPAPGCASAGEYFVPGHLVHYGTPPVPPATVGVPWELWTAPAGTVSPRLTAIAGGGGCQNLAWVKFDAASGLFYVTPLGEATIAVEILWNGISKVADITGPDTLFDMAN